MAQRRRWEDLATTTSKRSVGSGGQGGDNGNDVDLRGDNYTDITISLAMATGWRATKSAMAARAMATTKGLQASDGDGAEEGGGGSNEGGG